MEDKGNNNQSTQESSSVSQHRHQAAKEFTKELIEELLSTDSDDTPARTVENKTTV